jgi:hypothetical protein
MFLRVFSHLTALVSSERGSGAFSTSAVRARRLQTSASELIPKVTMARLDCVSSGLD